MKTNAKETMRNAMQEGIYGIEQENEPQRDCLANGSSMLRSPHF